MYNRTGKPMVNEGPCESTATFITSRPPDREPTGCRMGRAPGVHHAASFVFLF